MGEVTRRRWLRALTWLAGVENHRAGPPATRRPRRVEIQGRRARLRSPRGPRALATGFEPHDAEPLSSDTPIRTLWAPVAADLVLMGKFDVDRHVRLRAFYDDSSQSLRVQGIQWYGRDPISRSLEAARLVAQHSPGLAPPVLGYGRLRGTDLGFLLEQTITGRPLNGASETLRALSQITRSLRQVHQALGIGAQPLSVVAGPSLAQSWQRSAGLLEVDDSLTETVTDLIVRDLQLDISFGHGDLVRSNVLTDGDRFTLIDWEHAGTRPVAFDLAKLHVNAGGASRATSVLGDALAGSVGAGPRRYSLAQQLALAHVCHVARHEVRAERARAAGRLAALRVRENRQLRAIAKLIDS